MGKKQFPTAKRAPTRRQVSRWQRERRTQRIILSIGIVVVLIVIGLLAFVYYRESIAPPREPAVQVNNQVFDMAHYVNQMRWNTAGGAFTQGGTPDIMLQSIVEDALIREGAPQLRIQVSDQEVTEELQRIFKLSQGSDQKFSEAAFQDWYRQRLEFFSLSDSDYRHFTQLSLLGNKIREHLGVEVPVAADQIHLQGIMRDTEDNANDIAAKLEAGQDFAELAKQVSLDDASKENGGDLGWLVPGLLAPEFEAAAFNLETNQLSKPFYASKDTADKAGYWVVRVIEKESGRAVDDATREQLKNLQIVQWLAEKKAQSEIKDMITPQKRAWAQEQVTGKKQ